MKYITPSPNPSGAYPAPQSNPFPGSIALTDEQASVLIQNNGFVAITKIGDTVTVTPNTEALDAWKAAMPPEPEHTPTQEERIASLEAENHLLNQKVAALTDQNDFQEELIVELANIVYS